MKEATGELNMTVITIVAIAAIGAILWALWPSIENTIRNSWGAASSNCPAGQVPTGNGGCHDPNTNN